MQFQIFNTHYPLNPSKSGSETSFALNAIVLILSLAVTIGCHFALGIKQPLELFVILLFSLLALTVVGETILYPKTAALRQLKVRRPLSWLRILYREVALIAALGAIAFAYWLFPLFADRAMQRFYYPFLTFFAPTLLLLSLPYFILADRLDPEEEDAHCRVGRALCTFKSNLTRFEFANWARSWAVKGFYFALMQPAAIEKIRTFLAYDWNTLTRGPTEVYLFASTVCYGLDLAYAAAGYILNFKLFNTHTRTAEPTLFGWMVAIFCYWPFWAVLFSPYFFRYQSPLLWNTLFTTGGFIWWIWAAVIVGCEAIYALATISAGIRFSNLTYRGLWDTGPYRWTKHPAYIFKNISWWFISVPFALNSGSAAIKCTILLLGVNLIYFARARTEERHLSHYPEYVAYAEKMNHKSIFRWCTRFIPALAYSKT